MPKQKTERPTPTSESSNGESCNEQLTAYIRSGKSGIYLTTFEEVRAEAEMLKIIPFLNSVKKNPKDKDWDFYIWSACKGITKLTMPGGGKPGKIEETENPMEMLENWMTKCPERSLMLAQDFHGFLAGDPDPILVRNLKEALMAGKQLNKVFIICGAKFNLPIELHKEMAQVDFKLPGKEQLGVVLDAIASGSGIHLDEEERDAVLDAASGLTTSEAEDAFAMSIVKRENILPAIIAKEKANTVKKNGILEIVESPLKRDDIAGSENFIEWLGKRASAFTREAKEYGLPTPKGVLVCGVPGTGKTLAGFIAANILGVPMLKLDVGRVFAGHVGESEANMRIVIDTAEAVAPCVLFLDEIEKAFSGTKSSGQTDGGTTSRVFGTFLSWLQDKTAPVFVFATANSITSLPPEFLRKGRFDDLWYVDLPNAEEREAIWRLHIAKRGRKPDKFDLAALAAQTEGYTGAEIEAMVAESLYASFDDGKRELKESDLIASIHNTVPRSRTMAGEIDALRAWANGRARRASAVKETTARGRKLA